MKRTFYDASESERGRKYANARNDKQNSGIPLFVLALAFTTCGKEKSGRPAGILCSNKEPVTGTCRIPLALTLQGKNKEPPTGRLQNMSKHGKLIMARKIPCQRSYKANSSGIRIKLRKHNRVKGVVAKHREGQKAIRGNANDTTEATQRASENRRPK